MATPEERRAHARKAKKTPKPPKPWNVPYPPTISGDHDVRALYASIGEALTTWERMEERLANLFAILVGLDDPSEIAERAYGAILTFRARKEMIERAAEFYFGLYPSAEIQSLFDEALSYANGYASRRNEIAHGKVMSFAKQDRSLEFLLFPPFYSSNKIKWYGEASGAVRKVVGI